MKILYFNIPIKLFWIVGIIAGILFIIIGYALFRLTKDTLRATENYKWQFILKRTIE